MDLAETAKYLNGAIPTMATTILDTFGTVHSDGTLVMDEKLAVAPGRVKVRVEATEMQ